MKLIPKIFIILISATILLNINAYCQAVNISHVKAKLISEVNKIQPGIPFQLAVGLTHEDEWHTYWRNPGDAGMATSILWKLPGGFTAEKIQWPYPEKLENGGIVTFGYEKVEYLFVRITPPEKLNSDTVKIDAQLNWLECKELCLPGASTISITLKTSNEKIIGNNNFTDEINYSHDKLPFKSGDWKFTAHREDSSIILVGMQSSNHSLLVQKIYFFPYEENIFSNSAEQVFTKIEGGFKLKIELETLREKDPELIRGVLMNYDGWVDHRKAMEINVSIE